ncbi:cyclic nucleotide-binding protein [Burkholderia pseudomallei]|uniref:Cyclic nucleotide-binding domain protein n=3 Tax=Burkholderia pseudomallei TaxID=28450 RepID=Q3JG47_BURP1|nr:Crp/Fnr family transcriptional regulator [Burkholderia pseudomallei]ABA52533.1 cyclic nucleotide-binding domain protein [Burkholderia pseudomallei 1710b]AYX04682.1 Crp/Fnr family transcriptional regulator [Burkholderia pseudomallei]MUU85646.1 helix-turn-helix domain-containing protein [Burkholderia pseudomallei]MVZ87658.1 helix-turn-helix domain-containing protein [Burkholderia pseudomallei]MWA21541.1 helix-turn-helix domain-containing protein [Burkholderia pseudomallei]
MQATDSPNTTARIPYPRKPCVMTDDVQAPHRPPLAADEAARADEAAAEPASAPAEAPVEAPIEAPVETSAAAPVRAPAAAAGAGELRALFSRCGWFNTLAPEHQALVVAQSHAEYRDAGDWVARRQAPSEYWIGVHRGLVKLAIYNASGRGCTFSGVPSGGWFGEGSVIKRELRKYDVIAIQRSLVLFVPSATFHALLDSSLPFTGFVIRQLNNRMGEFIASIQNSRLLDVNARVAQSLAQLFNPDLYPDTGATLAISQEELGMLVGVSRQRINQALQHLERLGAVRLAYNQIDVLDLPKLAAFGMEQI